MKKIRELYRSSIPYDLRDKIKLLMFQFLRTSIIQAALNLFDILICRNYFQLNQSTLERFLSNQSGNLPPIKYYTVAEKVKTEPAIHLHEQSISDLQPFSMFTNSIILDVLHIHKFSLRENHLIDSNMNIVGGYKKKFEELPIYKRILSSTIHLEGTIAYLSDPQPSNYYHWMCGILPQLRLYEQFFELDDIDFFYVGQFEMSQFHKESLCRAGIPLNKIIQNNCTADRILAAISSRFIPKFNDPISKESYCFTQSLFKDECSSGLSSRKRRIYVARGNATRRKLVNENEILQLLSNYGFEVIQTDNKTVSEQAEIFSQAEVVIALHGAALTNLLFIQPGTKVIELFPNGYINNCYYVMSSYAKAKYFYLQGERIQQSHLDPHYFDTYINIQKLKTICEQANL
jgi:hypothetical protein